MQFILLLAAIVAGCTQGLEGPHQEGFPIASMGLQVVGDGGGGEGLACQAHGAQRLGCELALSPLAPGDRVVQVGVAVSWHRAG